MIRQRGFSLVELMVSMVLGLIVTAAAFQMFLINQQTFSLQQVTSQLEEDGQLILRYLKRDLRRAGGTSRAGMNQAGNSCTVPASSHALGVVVENVVCDGRTFPASSGTGNAQDRMTLTFSAFNDGRQTNANRVIADCQGSVVTLQDNEWVRVVNTYFVQNGSLRCRGSLSSGSATVELLSGVDGFRVLYGVANAAGNNAYAHRYRDAENITNTDRIMAVRLAILLRGESNSLPEGPEGTRYLLDTQFQEPADNTMRRQFVTTIQMRNALATANL